jgi:hypothetical protein
MAPHAQDRNRKLCALFDEQTRATTPTAPALICALRALVNYPEKTARMNLVGKSKEQIEQATRNKKRHELIEIIYSLATFEPMFKPQEIATRRRMSKGKVLGLIKTGVLRAHKPLDNALRVPLSAIRDWDSQTALFFSREPNQERDDHVTR